MANSMNQLSKKILRSVVNRLPKALAYPLMRSSLRISYALPQGLEIRVARTAPELEAAYRILHDSYVEMGYMNPEASGMRITKYFALPTTTTLIAVLNEEVIGTLSIIQRTKMGLPMENLAAIDSLVKGESAAEVSSLAVSAKYRHAGGAVFLPLCKYFYQYTRQYLGIKKIFIATTQEWAKFYEAFLLFDVLPTTQAQQENYSFVQYQKPVVLWGDLSVLEQKFEKIYNHKNIAKNLFLYFTRTKLQGLSFPERTFKKSMDPVMDRTLFSRFFAKDSQVLAQLQRHERQLLTNLYPASFHDLWESNAAPQDREQRFMSNLQIDSQIQIVDVSNKGLKIQGLKTRQDIMTLHALVSPNQSSKLKLKLEWFDLSKLEAGFSIVESDTVWNDYIQYLMADFDNISIHRNESTALMSKKQRRVL